MVDVSNTRDLLGDGEVARHLRARAWLGTTLGEPATWSTELLTVVNWVLTSPTPFIVWWGDAHIVLFNDAYREVLGDRDRVEVQLAMLGRPARDVLGKAWEVLAAPVAHVFATATGIVVEDVSVEDPM